MASRETIVGIFQALKKAGIRPSDATPVDVLSAWEPVFADVQDEDLMVAALAYIRSSTSAFWPVPGAIRAHLPVPANVDPDWAEAYSRIAEVARRRGSGRYDRVRQGISEGSDFEGFFPRNPAAEVATRAGIDAIGGWLTYCMSESGDQTVRAAFRDSYKAALTTAKRRDDDRAVRALLGRAGFGEIEGPGLRLLTGGRS